MFHHVAVDINVTVSIVIISLRSTIHLHTVQYIHNGTNDCRPGYVIISTTVCMRV